MATKVEVDDPKLMTEKKVDSGGKLYVGNQWAGKHLKIIVADEVEDGDE
jgi:hypothetical protein